MPLSLLRSRDSFFLFFHKEKLIFVGIYEYFAKIKTVYKNINISFRLENFIQDYGCFPKI